MKLRGMPPCAQRAHQFQIQAESRSSRAKHQCDWVSAVNSSCDGCALNYFVRGFAGSRIRETEVGEDVAP